MDIYQRKRDFEICGVGFCGTTRDEFISEVMDMPTTPVSGTVAMIGVPGIISAKENPKVAEVYNKASFAAIDGMPIVRMAKKRGFVVERCAAPDVMKSLMREGINQGKTHYFYGGKNEKILELIRKNLETDLPDIKIAGMFSPPFRPLTEDEDKKICEDINDKKPDFLWVGLGAPKQEIWMYEHRIKIHNTVMIGVGAGFDFLAGTLDKAPKWMEDASIEWLYRLFKEPKRLWRRYIIGGIKWLYYVSTDRYKGDKRQNG